MKPCLHINTSDMEPEPLPIILSREHGVEYLDTSLFISAPFYLSAIKWETEELAGLYPATEGLFQGNREGPCYVLAGSLENMCRGYLPLFKDANYFPLKLHTKKIKNRISLKWIYNQWSSSCQDHGPGDIYQILWVPQSSRVFQVYPGQRGGWSRARTC